MQKTLRSILPLLLLSGLTLPSAELVRSYDPFTGQVTLMATPDPETVIYALEEPLPEGVSVRTLSHGGIYDPFSMKLKWGPFFDDEARTFSYQLVAAAEQEINFSGVASWDGSEVQVAEGVTVGAVPVDAYFTWLLDNLGAEALSQGEPDPTSDSDRDRYSLLSEYVFGMTPGIRDGPPIYSVAWDRSTDLIEFRFQRRQNLDPVEVRFRESDNLQDWSEFDPGEPQLLGNLNDEVGIYAIMRDLTGARKFIELQFLLPESTASE